MREADQPRQHISRRVQRTTRDLSFTTALISFVRELLLFRDD